MDEDAKNLSNKARKYVAKAKAMAAANNIELTDWENEFIDSLGERLEKYGRAFKDPDLGAMNAPLSLRQGLKVKQIRLKAKGESEKKAPQKPRKPLRAKSEKKLKLEAAKKRKYVKTLNRPNKV